MKRYYGIESKEKDMASPNESKRKKQLLEKLLAEAEDRKRKFQESMKIKNVDRKEFSNRLKCKISKEFIENIQTESINDDSKSTVKYTQHFDKKDGHKHVSSDDSSSANENSQKSQLDFQKKDGKIFEKEIGYTILGETRRSKKSKIQRVLPDWLANPFVVTSNLHGKKMHVDECHNLDSSICQKLKETGITEFFPIQQVVVPLLIDVNTKRWLCRPNDVCVSAPTGSGKTLAFVLPVIQSLKDHVVTAVRCLAVLPVRDLANQVYNVFKYYCKNTSLSVIQITGISTFAQEQVLLNRKGVRGYQSLADIVIATPGRLIDHIHNTPGFSLKQLRFLILDEADRMMDEIQQGWLVEIEKAIYGERLSLSNCCNVTELFQHPRNNFLTSCSFGQIYDPIQKLLYSATLSQDSEKIEQLLLFCPKLISTHAYTESNLNLKSKQGKETIKNVALMTNVDTYITPIELKEYYVLCELSIKPLIVWYLIKSKQFKKTLCFTNSIQNSHRLSLVLKEIGEFTVSEFSSKLSGFQRKKAIKGFISGSINVLVCSDVMARGIDIEDIDCVILYDIPTHARTYVHRVGRTARAGKPGTAITLVESYEKKKFLFMMKSVSRKNLSELHISHNELVFYQQRYQTALMITANSIETEHHQQIIKKHPSRRKKKKM